MATVVLERFDSRGTETGSGASVELTYNIKGTASDTEALAALEAEAAGSYGGLVRSRVALEPVHIDEGNPDDCVWSGTVEYTRPENEREVPETGDSSFSFDTGGGTQHITQSLETVGSYTASGTAPNFKGAIGVTHDSVEGVDITVPVYQFAETHYLANSVVTNAYKGKLFRLTGKVCNASFKGLDEGECLFLGAIGSQRGSGADWEVTFLFAGSENKTNLTVGDITGINKKGWEYLWVRYQDVTEDSPGLVAPMVVKQPVAVYVERVYEYGNFADLGIGT